MGLKALCQRFFGWRATAPRSKPTAARRRGLQLSVERLESRTCLSSFTAGSVSQLIADINTANHHGGSNTITLVAGRTFTLDRVNNYTDGSTGLPVISANDHLTIIGNGDTIARSTADGTDYLRLFDVAAGASLTLQNLTLQGGFVVGGESYPLPDVFAEGGAIYNQGTLDLNGVTVQNTTAVGYAPQPGLGVPGPAAGAGIYSNGSLTLEGGTKVQNNQVFGGRALGGGLYVAGGTVNLNGATFSANTAQAGGGLYVAAGLVNVNGGTISANTARSGGGVYVAGGTVNLNGTDASGNTAQGAPAPPGHWVTVGAKVFTRRVWVPGIAGSGFGGGLYLAGGTVTMRGDSVMGNSALRGSGGVGGAGEGGGVYIGFASVFLDAFTQANVIHNTASTSDPDVHGPWTAI